MRRLAAIMFTDLVGYTELTQKNEALALELLEEHRGLLRPFFNEYQGKEIKTIGDGFLVEFPSAVEATKCALDIQKALKAHTSVKKPEQQFQVRIGLHIGDVVFEDGDVLGDGVNIASRIEPLAQPGGICVSDAIADQVRNKIDAPLESMGERKLKGVQNPVTIYRLVMPWEKFSSKVRTSHSKSPRLRWVLPGLIAVLIAASAVWWVPILKTPEINLKESPRLAVLPLANLMNDPKQEYFVEGMHDALITELSKLNGLMVISRQSVLKYRNSDKSMPEIAQELNAQWIVEGSILRDKDNVRVNVQLIDASTDQHLWAEMFDRRMENVLTLHSQLTQAIASQIKLTLSPQEEAKIAGNRQVNPETYELYLKGMYHIRKWGQENWDTGMAYLNQAVENDPNEALGYSGLALAYSIIGHYMDPSAYRQAREMALKALALDSTLAEPYQALAEYEVYYNYNVAAAKSMYEKVISISPNFVDGHAHYSWLLIILGRNQEAAAEMKLAQELDPLSSHNYTYAGWQNFYIGDYENGLEPVNRALKMNSQGLWAHYVLGCLLSNLGRFDEGIKAHEKAVEIWPELIWALGYSYALAGRDDEALTIARKVADDPSPFDTWGLAMIYTALGDKDNAINWLEEGSRVHWSFIPWIRKVSAFRSLQGDPRFEALADKVTI